MESLGPKLTGISLSVLGWMLSVISCALPMWRVVIYEYNEDGNTRVEWWGLWMRCVFQSAGQMECSFHQFIHKGVPALRTLSVITLIVGVVGVFINMVGAKCTNCIQNERVKARLMASSGRVFIIAALVQLVPVFWFISITSRGYHYTYPGEKAGVSLYLGWVASVLMFIGGSILCCICPPQEDKPRKYIIHGQSYIEYSATPRSTAQSSNNKREEV